MYYHLIFSPNIILIVEYIHNKKKIKQRELTEVLWPINGCVTYERLWLLVKD